MTPSFHQIDTQLCSSSDLPDLNLFKAAKYSVFLLYNLDLDPFHFCVYTDFANSLLTIYLFWGRQKVGTTQLGLCIFYKQLPFTIK